jgi:hypothetical protein
MENNEWLAAKAEWENPANWRWHGLYIAPRDPRVWVRKRNPIYGWTINLAHRQSWIWLGYLWRSSRDRDLAGSLSFWPTFSVLQW